MKRNFGSSFTSASAAVGRKSLNMISTTGRRPVTAIPSATPRKPFSQIGVLTIRSSPNSSGRPSFVLKTPPAVATSSPMSSTVGSSRSSCSSAARIASRYEISTTCPSEAATASGARCVDIALDLLERRGGRLGGTSRARVHLGLDLLVPGALLLLRDDALGRELRAEQVDRVA